MRKSIIVAVSRNGVIGKDNQLPWRLPADLKRFKELTMGHTLIMGRKTYESLPPKLRPLPGRSTIVLTRAEGRKGLTRDDTQASMFTASSLNEAIMDALMDVSETEVFVCGGGEVYREALPLVDRVYLTVVERDFEGDTEFRFGRLEHLIEEKCFGNVTWQKVSSERGEGDIPHRFEIWDRSR